MAADIVIQVLSVGPGAQAPMATARVTLIQRSAVEQKISGSSFDMLPITHRTDMPVTHQHRSNGNYALDAAVATPVVPGEWFLHVSAQGKSPVVQRITIDEDQGVLRVRPGWAPKFGRVEHAAATVSIPAAEKRPTGSALPPPATIVVRLFDRREVVILCGHDSKGIPFVNFGPGRRNMLFESGEIDEGTIAVLFLADTRDRKTFVKSALKDTKDWIEVESLHKSPGLPPFAKIDKDGVGDPDAEIGVIDLYRYVDTLGGEASTRGVVTEVSVFSHSFIDGPIIHNTFHDESNIFRHTPGDLDGRRLDWHPLGDVLRTFSRMPAALATNSVWRLWGCQHMLALIARANAALPRLKAGRPRDEFFVVQLTSPEKNGLKGRENLTLAHLKKSMAQLAVSKSIRKENGEGSGRPVVSYPGAAAQALGSAVRAAPPGVGAFFRIRNKNFHMFINRGNAENVRILEYLAMEFGSLVEPDAFGYIDYNVFRTANVSDPGFSPERFTILRWGKTRLLRIATGLEIIRPTAEPDFSESEPQPPSITDIGRFFVAPLSNPVDIVENPVTTPPTLNLSLALSDKRDTGIFVGQDGRVLLMMRVPSGRTGQWQPDAVSLPVRISPNINVHTGRTMSGPLLEQVTPQWFW